MNSISRRSFLALASTLIVTASIPQVSFASSKGMRSKEQADDIIVYSDDLFTVIQRDQTFIIKDRFGCSMSCAFNNQNSSILVTFPDNSTHTLSQDENGCVLIDGTLATDLLYVHEQGLPLPKGCVLMSTQKMTFERAMQPSQIAVELLGALPFGTFWDIAMSMAGSIFDWQVAHNQGSWVIVKHYYCDTPEMHTRKEYYHYSNEACTNLINYWEVESPVGGMPS